MTKPWYKRDLKSWVQICIPHKDIRDNREGKWDESVFAADLSDVVADRGPLEYRDARLFFQKTYPTQGLRSLLGSVLSRLSGVGTGEAVIQIQTPFGGGKTHCLIALYHLFRKPQEAMDSELGKEILKALGVKVVPEVRVVTFVGTAADPLKGRTPWGELAWQLGDYELLSEHDGKRRAPGKDLILQLIAKAPTLILMDEIAEYAIKAKDYQDQVMAFFQELTEAVKVQPRCALVVTLPSSAPYGEEGERVLHQLQQIFGRMEAIYTPVEGEEIYEVIRCRLFEEIVDPKEAKRTTDTYWDMYQELGDDVPREAREKAYQERLRKAYPFHPELIDILFERWSTFPTFQRTRGVLRLLAEVVADRYRKNDTASLILPSHIDLSNPTIRREFLKHIGNEFEGVIASDIAGPNAKAPLIDRELGSEYVRFGVASGLATAIFFGSFSGGERRGVSLTKLRLMVLQDRLPVPIIGDALQRLRETLWYLHEEGGIYQFRSQPNLNRVIIEKEEAVRPEDISEEMKKRLEKHAKPTEGMEIFLWPHNSRDIPDNRKLKLAILPPEYNYQDSQTKVYVQELLNRCGQTFRVYRNTLLLLVADQWDLQSARQQIRRYLAYKSILADETLRRQLSQENRKTLEERIKDAEEAIEYQLLTVYRYLVKMEEEEDLRWFDLGLPTVRRKLSIAERVSEYLKREEVLLFKVSPRYILEKTLRPDETEKSLREIYEAFLRYPHLSMLGGKEALFESVAKGVAEGLFGIKMGERVYFRETVPPSQIEEDALLIRASELEKVTLGTPMERPPSRITPLGMDEVQTAEAATVSKRGDVFSYTLRAQIPWDKLHEFLRGVVMPLHNEGAELTVKIELKAQSKGGIKQTTLDLKVRETLKHIGAKDVEETLEN